MMKAMERDAVYTLQEAAAFLKVNERTLQRLAVKGKVPAFRVGRQWRFYGRDLLELGESEAGTGRALV